MRNTGSLRASRLMALSCRFENLRTIPPADTIFVGSAATAFSPASVASIASVFSGFRVRFIALGLNPMQHSFRKKKKWSKKLLLFGGFCL